MKKVLAFLAGILLMLILYLLFWPSNIDPLPFNPPEALEMSGVFEPNTELRKADYLGKGQFNGPEDIALDAEGRLYGGADDGSIHRMGSDGIVEVFANTGGRPLGMMFDSDDNLIVADAWKGLLSINPNGDIEILTTESEGIPFSFTNDVDIAKDGTIYFSDASSCFNQPEYLYDLLEARPHGRLLKYDPKSQSTTTLLDSLHFANGVALSADEDFVLVNETYRYQITRYWLSSDRAGESEIFIDNLPGFPDNISQTGDGRFWMALFTVRNDLMDRLHPSPFKKRILSKLPSFLWPKPAPYGFVVELDEQGDVLRTLQDPGGEHLTTITSAKKIDGILYMGSLYNDRVGKLNLKRVE